MVGEGVDARELPKLLLLMKPFTAVPLVIPVDDNPPFRASINVVNSCLKKNKVRGDFYPRVLSISLKFWFEVSEIPLYRMAHSSCTDQPWRVVTGMLVVLLRSENCRFWSHLGWASPSLLYESPPPPPPPAKPETQPKPLCIWLFSL